MLEPLPPLSEGSLLALSPLLMSLAVGASMRSLVSSELANRLGLIRPYRPTFLKTAPPGHNNRPSSPLGSGQETPMLRDTILALADVFVTDLISALRNATLEDIVSLRAGGPSSQVAAALAPAKRGPGRPKGSGASGGAAPSSGGRLARRSESDISGAAMSIVEHVQKHPGSRSETIRAALGIEKNEWAKPLAYALEHLGLKKQGNKRATEYSVGGAPGKATKTGESKQKAAKAKAAPKKAKKANSHVRAAMAATKAAPKKTAKPRRTKAAARRALDKVIQNGAKNGAAHDPVPVAAESGDLDEATA